MSQPNYPINNILAAFRRLVPKNEKILISCSGGADSMALLFCAQKTGNPLEVIHVVHDMRSYEDSMKDHDLVQSYCLENRIPFNPCQAKLKPDISAEHPRFSELKDILISKIPTENDYRICRKNLVETCAIQKGCKYVATGHHADDQLETILMKLCRGSGLRGMSGISEILTCPGYDFSYIRPLLCISKDSAYAICKLNSIPFNEDQTNKDTNYTRNAIRHEVLPVLKALFPHCSENSNNAAKIFADAQEAIEDTLSDLKKYEKDNISFDYEGNFENGEPEYSINVDALRISKDIVIYEWLRKTYADIVYYYAKIDFDNINKTMTDKVIHAIRNHQSVGFTWPNNIKIQINKTSVRMYHEKNSSDS